MIEYLMKNSYNETNDENDDDVGEKGETILLWLSKGLIDFLVRITITSYVEVRTILTHCYN